MGGGVGGEAVQREQKSVPGSGGCLVGASVLPMGIYIYIYTCIGKTKTTVVLLGYMQSLILHARIGYPRRFIRKGLRQTPGMVNCDPLAKSIHAHISRPKGT